MLPVIDAFTTILASSAVSTILVSVLGYITREWITERLKNSIRHEYEMKLETYRAQLKCDADVALERMRSDLQIAAAERNVRYSRIYEQALESIAETYAKLVEFRNAVGAYVNPMGFKDDPSLEERRKIVGAKGDDFRNYFNSRKLFFPKELADKVTAFSSKMMHLAIRFMYGVEQEDDSGRRGRAPDAEAWGEIVETMTDEVPALLEALEADFRRLIGTDDLVKKDITKTAQ